MRKKLYISLAELFFGVVVPFMLRLKGKSNGFQNIIFIWMILGSAICVALNDSYRRRQVWFIILEILGVLLYLGSFVLAYIAISLRGLTIL